MTNLSFDRRGQGSPGGIRTHFPRQTIHYPQRNWHHDYHEGKATLASSHEFSIAEQLQVEHQQLSFRGEDALDGLMMAGDRLIAVFNIKCNMAVLFMLKLVNHHHRPHECIFASTK